MKAPEHFSPPPENGTHDINYSMLPPEKLPNWLLAKKAPEKINNFSMRPPGTQEIASSPLPEDRRPEPVVVSYPPPAPPPPEVQSTVTVETPAVPALTAPDAPSFEVENQAEPSVIASNRTDTPEPVEQEPPPAPVFVDNVITEETIPDFVPSDSAIQHSIEQVPMPTEPVVSPVEMPTAVEWQQPPVVPPTPPQYTEHRSRPSAYSLGDWIYNNTTTAMIIVAAVIAFVILILVLVEFGVI